MLGSLCSFSLFYLKLMGPACYASVLSTLRQLNNLMSVKNNIAHVIGLVAHLTEVPYNHLWMHLHIINSHTITRVSERMIVAVMNV